MSVTFDTIRDIAGTDTWVRRPIDKLRDLAEECTDELDAYSRFIGKRPNGAGSAAAISLLPDVLLPHLWQSDRRPT